MASTRARVGWTIAGTVFVLLFGLQIPGCMTANTPKVGRVVNATTGKGMAGVTVIASAYVCEAMSAGNNEPRPGYANSCGLPMLYNSSTR
jgi:hypothetical protein